MTKYKEPINIYWVIVILLSLVQSTIFYPKNIFLEVYILLTHQTIRLSLLITVIHLTLISFIFEFMSHNHYQMHAYHISTINLKYTNFLSNFTVKYSFKSRKYQNNSDTLNLVPFITSKSKNNQAFLDLNNPAPNSSVAPLRRSIFIDSTLKISNPHSTRFSRIQPSSSNPRQN